MGLQEISLSVLMSREVHGVESGFSFHYSWKEERLSTGATLTLSVCVLVCVDCVCEVFTCVGWDCPLLSLL